MERDSIIFYKSFYEAIKNLPRDIQGEIYTAIMEYGLYGNEIENLKPVARSVFVLIKPQLDANNQRYLNGLKGGRPRQDETEQEPNDNQAITKHKPNVKDNDNVKEKEKVKDINNSIEEIYKAYPTKCQVRKASSGKTAKNKDQIKRLLEKGHTKEELLSTIGRYVDDCVRNGTYMKNFSTFLNNLPDYEEEEEAESTLPENDGGFRDFRIIDKPQ